MNDEQTQTENPTRSEPAAAPEVAPQATVADPVTDPASESVQESTQPPQTPPLKGGETDNLETLPPRPSSEMAGQAAIPTGLSWEDHIGKQIDSGVETLPQESQNTAKTTEPTAPNGVIGAVEPQKPVESLKAVEVAVKQVDSGVNPPPQNLIGALLARAKSALQSRP